MPLNKNFKPNKIWHRLNVHVQFRNDRQSGSQVYNGHKLFNNGRGIGVYRQLSMEYHKHSIV